jgi:hypothetical protein
MADATVSNTVEGNLMWVRPPPSAPAYNDLTSDRSAQVSTTDSFVVITGRAPSMHAVKPRRGVVCRGWIMLVVGAWPAMYAKRTDNTLATYSAGVIASQTPADARVARIALRHYVLMIHEVILDVLACASATLLRVAPSIKSRRQPIGQVDA